MPARRRLIVFRRADSLWDWRLIDGYNAQVVATSGSQGYSERNDASEAASREHPDLPVEIEDLTEGA